MALPRSDEAGDAEVGNRVCSLRCRGFNGWLGVVDWSGSSQTSLATIAEGTPRW
jgi:hypothetical protein